jgi:parallel beta helix pectate lyase-like protein
MGKGNSRPVMMALAVVLLLAVYAPYAFAATAVSSCRTISSPGNYVLTSNLTSTGTCLVITARGVALDFNNHTITGNGTGDGIDDGGTQFLNIVIANGTVKGFNIGINFPTNGEALAINNMTVLNNTSTGIVINGFGQSLTGVKSTGNGGAGIDMTSTSNSAFTDVTVTGNGKDGILAPSSNNDNAFTNIQAQNNTGNGIELSSSNNNFVTNSLLTGNGGDGVAFLGEGNGDAIIIVTGSTAVGNAGIGFDITGTANTLANDIANNNGQGGASVICPSNVTNLSAHGNTGGNLKEDTSSGSCINLNNNAP